MELKLTFRWSPFSQAKRMRRQHQETKTRLLLCRERKDIQPESWAKPSRLPVTMGPSCTNSLGRRLANTEKTRKRYNVTGFNQRSSSTYGRDEPTLLPSVTAQWRPLSAGPQDTLQYQPSQVQVYSCAGFWKTRTQRAFPAEAFVVVPG